MTYSEFIDLYGAPVNFAIFNELDDTYMTNTLDKDAFIKKVKKQRLVEKIAMRMLNEIADAKSAVIDKIDACIHKTDDSELLKLCLQETRASICNL